MNIKQIIFDVIGGNLTLLDDEATNEGLFEYLFDLYPTLSGDEIAKAIDDLLKEAK